jgi:hypothetical protein
MIIAIDFDGIIARDERWPEIGSMLPGARETIDKLREAGNFVIINTCRSNGDLIAAVDWMRQNDIGFDLINDNHPDLVKKHANNSRKIFADIYIDNSNLGGFPGWNSFEVRSLYEKNLKKCSGEYLRITALRICPEFGFSFDEMICKTRKREMVDLRFMFFWFGRKALGLPFGVIGTVFNRDHASVIFGVGEVEKLKENDKLFQQKFNKFKTLLNDSNIEI